jgi:hypothetical protein
MHLRVESRVESAGDRATESFGSGRAVVRTSTGSLIRPPDAGQPVDFDSNVAAMGVVLRLA